MVFAKTPWSFPPNTKIQNPFSRNRRRLVKSIPWAPPSCKSLLFIYSRSPLQAFHLSKSPSFVKLSFLRSMASLVLLLSEVFKRETPDLLLSGASFPASQVTAFSLKGKQVTAFSSLAGKKPMARSPHVVRSADEDDAVEDPSEMKIAIDMVWS